MSKALIKFYKGVVVNQIHRHLKGKMTKAEIDEDIKINAGYFGSCKDGSIEELQNLIIMGFMYGDAVGIFIDYPEDELDKLINLNI
jgi:hypothetical protein